MDFVVRWLLAFVFTEVVETGVYVQALGDRPLKERLAIGLGASAITHPVLWFVVTEVMQSLGLTWWPTVAVGEAWVVAVEATWLWAFGVRRALLWSLAANFTSFALGLVGYVLLGW